MHHEQDLKEHSNYIHQKCMARGQEKELSSDFKYHRKCINYAEYCD